MVDNEGALITTPNPPLLLWPIGPSVSNLWVVGQMWPVTYVSVAAIILIISISLYLCDIGTFFKTLSICKCESMQRHLWYPLFSYPPSPPVR